jgi:hypothetical protein
MSGVSVRTLHFYDETGLLKNSFVMTMAAGQPSRKQVATYPPYTREPGTEWRSRIERTSNEGLDREVYVTSGGCATALSRVTRLKQSLRDFSWEE